MKYKQMTGHLETFQIGYDLFEGFMSVIYFLLIFSKCIVHVHVVNELPVNWTPIRIRSIYKAVTELLDDGGNAYIIGQRKIVDKPLPEQSNQHLFIEHT